MTDNPIAHVVTPNAYTTANVYEEGGHRPRALRLDAVLIRADESLSYLVSNVHEFGNSWIVTIGHDGVTMVELEERSEDGDE